MAKSTTVPTDYPQLRVEYFEDPKIDSTLCPICKKHMLRGIEVWIGDDVVSMHKPCWATTSRIITALVAQLPPI